jgi:transmembrane sensor
MTGAEETILAAAAAWHLASARDDMDWAGFAAWLEADSRHRAAYDEIALTDALLDQHREALVPLAAEAVPERSPGMRRWPLWLGGALAASLAAVLLEPQFAAPEPQTYASGAAAQDIALADGSSVVLGPHSRLTVAGRHGDQLALEGGAYFAVRHDPGRPLTIRAGGLEIGDIGTQFDVQAGARDVRVAVSEGRVEVRGQALGQPVELAAGRRMLFDPDRHLAAVTAVAAGDVGGWREGRLSYEAAPLALVAGDLARYAGVTVSVPAALAGRRFSGTLSIKDGTSAVRDLAQLMGLGLSRDAGAYRLAEPG